MKLTRRSKINLELHKNAIIAGYLDEWQGIPKYDNGNAPIMHSYGIGRGVVKKLRSINCELTKTFFDGFKVFIMESFDNTQASSAVLKHMAKHPRKGYYEISMIMQIVNDYIGMRVLDMERIEKQKIKRMRIRFILFIVGFCVSNIAFRLLS